MKTSHVLVCGINSGISVSGVNVVAVLPHKKGEKISYCLLADGRISLVKGTRLGGVGIVKAFTSDGFVPAPAGDDGAEKLALKADHADGLKLVEEAAQAAAMSIMKENALKTVKFVPYDASQPTRTCELDEAKGFVSVAVSFGEAFTDALVRVKYGQGMDLGIGKGWIVDNTVNEAELPRVTEYGGPIERAVYTIANSRLATLVGNHHLEMNPDAAENDPYPRGKVTLKLANGDLLVVGTDSSDELVVSYVREDKVIYQVNGMTKPEYGSIIGDIASALVRVNEMDAFAASKKPKLKKAA